MNLTTTTTTTITATGAKHPVSGLCSWKGLYSSINSDGYVWSYHQFHFCFFTQWTGKHLVNLPKVIAVSEVSWACHGLAFVNSWQLWRFAGNLYNIGLIIILKRRGKSTRGCTPLWDCVDSCDSGERFLFCSGIVVFNPSFILWKWPQLNPLLHQAVYGRNFFFLSLGWENMCSSLQENFIQ